MTEPSYGIESAPCRSGKAGGNEKEKRNYRFPREREGWRQRLRTGPLSGDALLRTVDQTAERCPRPKSVYRRKQEQAKDERKLGLVRGRVFPSLPEARVGTGVLTCPAERPGAPDKPGFGLTGGRARQLACIRQIRRTGDLSSHSPVGHRHQLSLCPNILIIPSANYCTSGENLFTRHKFYKFSYYTNRRKPYSGRFAPSLEGVTP